MVFIWQYGGYGTMSDAWLRRIVWIGIPLISLTIWYYIIKLIMYLWGGQNDVFLDIWNIWHMGLDTTQFTCMGYTVNASYDIWIYHMDCNTIDYNDRKIIR